MERRNKKGHGVPCPPRRKIGNCELLVDVVLLPVEGGVGLDDDVFVRGLFELVHQHGLARFKSLRDFGVDTKS